MVEFTEVDNIGLYKDRIGTSERVRMKGGDRLFRGSRDRDSTVVPTGVHHGKTGLLDAEFQRYSCSGFPECKYSRLKWC